MSELVIEMKKRGERMERALKERMYLLSADYNNSNYWEFLVEGSRGTNYDVTFKETGMNCTCPFAKTRYKTCKHMFFIIGRVCKLSLVKLEDTDNFRINIFQRYPELEPKLTEVINNRNNTSEIPEITSMTISGDCVICFEELNGALYNCSTCKNHFHDDCIKRWKKQTNACPLCRRPIITNVDSEKPVNVLSKFNLKI